MQSGDLECLAEGAAGFTAKNSDCSGRLMAGARALSELLDKEPNFGGSQKTLKGPGTTGVGFQGMDAGGWGPTAVIRVWEI